MANVIATGIEAIEIATRRGLPLCKYADPVEDAREGLSVEEARELAEQDPGLIYLPPVDRRIEVDGFTAIVTELRPDRYSLRFVGDEAEAIYDHLPSDESISAACGLPLTFFDAGDDPTHPEAIYRLTISTGDRVTAGRGSDKESGQVVEIVGARALIAWEQGTRTWADLSSLELAD